MGEAFLVGGSSAMSSSGAVKSRQEIVVSKQAVTLSDSDFYSSSTAKAYYADFTIQSVNIDKTIIIANTTSYTRDAMSLMPCARFINSNTIRIYATYDYGSGAYICGFYVQIIEFY